MKKSVVLLSGGLDSATSFKQAVDETEVVIALTFDYGQKAAKKEISAATAMCLRFKVKHKVITLPWYGEVLEGALVDKTVNPPQIKDFSSAVTTGSAQRVWAFNRNGLFTNIAAVFAEKNCCDYIITGFNLEEAQTFPDNSEEFCKAASAALGYSTKNKPLLMSYTQKLTKSQIVALGIALGAPLDLVWSCYLGEEIMCGQCESCQRLKKALAANDISTCEVRFANAELID